MKAISLSRTNPALAANRSITRSLSATWTGTGQLVVNDISTHTTVFDVMTSNPRCYDIVRPIFEGLEIAGVIDDYIVIVSVTNNDPHFRIFEMKDDPISWAESRYIVRANMFLSWMSICQIQTWGEKRYIWYVNDRSILVRGEIVGHRFFTTDILNLDPIKDKVESIFGNKYVLFKVAVLKSDLVVLFYNSIKQHPGISRIHISETRYLAAICDLRNGEILSIVPMKTTSARDKGMTPCFHLNQSETRLIITPDRYISYELPEGTCFPIEDYYDMTYLGDDLVITEQIHFSPQSAMRQDGYFIKKMGVCVIDPRPGRMARYEISAEEYVGRSVHCWRSNGKIVVMTMEYNDTQKKTFLADGIILESINDLEQLDQGEPVDESTQLTTTPDLRDSSIRPRYVEVSDLCQNVRS